jgi:mRNA interferase HigB
VRSVIKLEEIRVERRIFFMAESPIDYITFLAQPFILRKEELFQLIPKWEHDIVLNNEGGNAFYMRVISKKVLKEFWLKYPQSEASLRAWFAEAEKVEWETPQDIKKHFRSADFLKNNRVIFNISGNKYRLIVSINYSFKIVYVRFIGTHSEYDHIDPERV